MVFCALTPVSAIRPWRVSLLKYYRVCCAYTAYCLGLVCLNAQKVLNKYS